MSSKGRFYYWFAFCFAHISKQHATDFAFVRSAFCSFIQVSFSDADNQGTVKFLKSRNRKKQMLVMQYIPQVLIKKQKHWHDSEAITRKCNNTF